MAKTISEKAQAFSDEQLRILLGAMVEDADDLPAVSSAIKRLTPEEMRSKSTGCSKRNPPSSRSSPRRSGESEPPTAQRRPGVRLTRAKDRRKVFGFPYEPGANIRNGIWPALERWPDSVIMKCGRRA
jgi:hypothetical protein